MSDERCRTITLTSRPPVRIVESEWPQIAGHTQDDKDDERTVFIKIRQREDKLRAIVYGGIDDSDGTYRRAGYIAFGPHAADELIALVRQVAADLGSGDDIKSTADTVVAQFPAEDWTK